MQLLTKELREQLPALYATEKQTDVEKKVVCKFFTPWAAWTWYVMEFDGDDTFFGLVDGFEKEYGYFNLSEIQAIIGPAGLRVERDLYFKPISVAELEKKLGMTREEVTE